ncbi:MAG: hypothetical protein ABW199_01450 [Caulobacterales bacterium]
MQFRTFFLVAALAVAPAAFAQAPQQPIPQQQPGPPPQAGARAPAPDFSAQAPLTLTPAQRTADTALARDQIVRIEADQFGACVQNDLAVSRVSGALAPLRVAQDRQVRARGIAVYRYVFSATGCGREPRRHNVEVLHHRTLAPMAVALPMGTSVVTSIVLQGAFDAIFEPMMRQRFPTCTPASRLKITEANLAAGAPYVQGQPWTENWRFDACGAKGVATMEFTYDGRGLRIGAHVVPDETTAAAPQPPAATPTP